MLSMGIVGLPNVGKSTLFNALASGQAPVSNYPFTTIDSNLGVVAVPDSRLQELRKVLQPKECTPCTIEFIDIAGLVEGASRGEGLGNQFLGNIRQVDAIAHVLRCFEGDVAHVFGEIDPLRDAEVVETELLLADLEVLGRALEKARKAWKAEPKKHAGEEARLLRYQEALEAGKPLRSLGLQPEEEAEARRLGLLSARPLLYVANVSEGDGPDSPLLEGLRERTLWAAPGETLEVIPVSAAIEGELQQLEPEERSEFMRELGMETTALARLVEASFRLLGLIRFYTIVSGKLRAWEVPRGTPAPAAAGKIHTDMERGFIRARVVSSQELLEVGDLHELQHQGLVRTEGKGYEMQDGDVAEFFFSAS